MYLAMGFIYVTFGITYFTFFLYRLLKKIGNKDLTKGMLVSVLMIISILSIPAINYIRIYGTIYFHLLIICMLLEGLNLFLKRFKIFNYLFIMGILPVTILLVLFAYGYYNMNHIVKTEYFISSQKINKLKIVQVTDLHMATTMNVTKLRNICDEISTNNPDLVVLTGDIFDENTSLKDMKEASYELSKIKNRLGIYYVFGNHDTASYSAIPNFSEEDVRSALIQNGIVVLDDEVVTIANISIVGRSDAHYAGDNIRLPAKELLAALDENNYIIVLDHQPLDLNLNANLKADLQLSGHTHGGQMFPMRWIENMFSDRLVYGVRKINDFYAITSSGIAGWGYPIKTGASSEYVVIQVN